MLSTVRLLVLVLVLGASPVQPRHQSQWIIPEAGRALVGRMPRTPHIYLPLTVPRNSSCGIALAHMAAALTNGSLWAARMVDSWGKSSDGVFFGNWNSLGSYDECVTSSAPSPLSLRGKYCTIRATNRSITVGTTEAGAVEEAYQDVLEAAADLINSQLMSVNPHVSGLDPDDRFKYSTCMPDVCTLTELQDSLTQQLQTDMLVEACHVLHPPPQFTAGDISFMCGVALLGSIVVVATVLDFYICYSDKTALTKGKLKFVLAFSAYTNLGKVFHINTSSPPSTITCLHGMRVMSMTWVFWCHQMTVTLFWTANILNVQEIVNPLPWQVITNGFPSVDTFFFISGLLVAGGLLRELERSGTINYGIYALHRVIRLMPTIGFMAWMMATVVTHFISGPFSINYDSMQYKCHVHWWKDILFLNNFLAANGDCLGQTWYLACDMQLYLVAPLVVLPLYFFKTKGQMWVYFVTLVLLIVTPIITYVNDLPPMDFRLAFTPGIFFSLVYTMPWCRGAVYVVGVWLGYVFYRQGKRPVIISPVLVATGWTIATVTALLVVFGMYSYNTLPPKAQYDVMTQIVYSALGRPAWAAAVAWVVFACHNGYGGVVNGFLSHPVWQPLSRLAFTVYIISLLMYPVVYSARIPFYFSNLNKVMETVGNLFLVTLCSVLVSLLIESPIINLEKILLKRGERGKRKSAQETTEAAQQLAAQHDNHAFVDDKGEDQPLDHVKTAL